MLNSTESVNSVDDLPAQPRILSTGGGSDDGYKIPYEVVEADRFMMEVEQLQSLAKRRTAHHANDRESHQHLPIDSKVNKSRRSASLTPDLLKGMKYMPVVIVTRNNMNNDMSQTNDSESQLSKAHRSYAQVASSPKSDRMSNARTKDSKIEQKDAANLNVKHPISERKNQKNLIPPLSQSEVAKAFTMENVTLKLQHTMSAPKKSNHILNKNLTNHQSQARESETSKLPTTSTVYDQSLMQQMIYQRRIEKRDAILKELLETEKNYVEKLSHIVKFFAKPLMARTEIKNVSVILPRAQVNRIFISIEDLYVCHSDFFEDLKGKDVIVLLGFSNIDLAEKYRDKLSNSFAEILNSYLTKMENAMIPFLVSFNHSAQAAKYLMKKNDQFREFVRVAEHCAGYPLQSLMTEPVQRCEFSFLYDCKVTRYFSVPRYELLVKEFLKTVDEASESYLLQQLKDVHEQLRTTVQNTEKISKESDRKFKVFQIQNMLFQNQIKIVTPTRLWCYEGHLEVLYNKPKMFGKLSNEFLFILFSDILIYVSDRKSPAKIKDSLRVSEICVIDNPDHVRTVFEQSQMFESAQIMAPLMGDYEPSLALDNLNGSGSGITPTFSAIFLNSSMQFQRSENNKKQGVSPPSTLVQFGRPKYVRNIHSNDRADDEKPPLDEPSFSASISDSPLHPISTQFKAQDALNSSLKFGKITNPGGVEWGRAFAICTMERTITCIAKSLSEKQKWVDEIRNAHTSSLEKDDSIEDGKIVHDKNITPSLMTTGGDFDDPEVNLRRHTFIGDSDELRPHHAKQ